MRVSKFGIERQRTPEVLDCAVEIAALGEQDSNVIPHLCRGIQAESLLEMLERGRNLPLVLEFQSPSFVRLGQGGARVLKIGPELGCLLELKDSRFPVTPFEHCQPLAKRCRGLLSFVPVLLNMAGSGKLLGSLCRLSCLPEQDA